MALHRVRLLSELERLLLDTVRAIAATIDAKDGYTHRHSERVAALARRIAAEMGLSADKQEVAELSALLHDVGKIAVPDSILNKPGRLTPEEFAEMRKHPVHGARILSNIQSPLVAAVLPGVRYHHEKWDGSGYPDGLRGDAIPLLGRLLGVADFLDALTSARDVSRAEVARRGGAAGVAGRRRALRSEIADAVVRLHRRGELTGEEAMAARGAPFVLRCSRLVVCLLLAAQLPRGGTPVTARFHHLHYRVQDPGAALGLRWNGSTDRARCFRAWVSAFGSGSNTCCSSVRPRPGRTGPPRASMTSISKRPNG